MVSCVSGSPVEMLSGLLSLIPRKNLLKKITGCGDIHNTGHHSLDVVLAYQSVDVGSVHMGDYKILSIRARIRVDGILNRFQNCSDDRLSVHFYVWSQRDECLLECVRSALK